MLQYRQSVEGKEAAGLAKTAAQDERVFGPVTAPAARMYRYGATKLTAARDPVVLGREVTILSGWLCEYTYVLYNILCTKYK